jgi:CheY-like chemotaxis protein
MIILSRRTEVVEIVTPAERGPRQDGLPVPSVLVVDDHAEIRDLLKVALVDAGYRVSTAQHGAEALAHVRTNTFAVILLDMQMPVMNGVAFLTTYRSLPGRRARVVVMTAGQDLVRQAELVEADAQLAKPFDLDVLLATMRGLIDSSVRVGE